LDPGIELLAAFGAGGLPYIAITDENGNIEFGHSGLAGEVTLREQLDSLV